MELGWGTGLEYLSFSGLQGPPSPGKYCGMNVPLAKGALLGMDADSDGMLMAKQNT